MVVTFDLRGPCSADASFNAEVLFEKAAMKIRRIELGAGARIPPCQMQEDVVFVVVAGRVAFRTDTDEALAVDMVLIGGAVGEKRESSESQAAPPVAGPITEV
jgi:hypothetical protein